MREMIAPTDSKATARKVSQGGYRVAYRPRPSVDVRERAEVIFARSIGRQSVAGAKDYLLQLREHAPLAVRAFLEAGTPERAIWFTQPITELLDIPHVVCPQLANRSQEEAEGSEDVRWQVYQDEPTEPNRMQWERAAHRLISSTQAKLAADRARREAL